MVSSDEFRQIMVSKGYDPSEVDGFLKSKMTLNDTGDISEAPNLDVEPNKFAINPVEKVEIDAIPNMKIDPQKPINVDQSTPMLSAEPTMGTQFGQRQAADIYSGGINYGTDVIVPKGTQVKAPPGKWQVVQAFADAKAEGPKNAQRGINSGYGNSVLLKNTETGEKIRLSHLTVGGVRVKPGQMVGGGELVGLSGATGNTAGQTGQHLDVEYYSPQGKISDIMKTPYRKYLGG